MDWISFIIFMAAMANLLLAFAVFWRRHSQPIHFVFAFFSTVTGLWVLSNFLLSLITEPQLFELIGRFSFAIAVLIAYSGVLLSWHFPETYHPTPHRLTLFTSAFLSLFFVFLSLTSLVQKSVEFGPEGPVPGFGQLYILYVIYMGALFCWMVWNLLSSRLRTPSGRDRMQVNYCLAGLAISFIGAYFCNFVLPQMTQHHQYYLLGSAWPLVWTSLTAYAICRYRLMDIGIALRNLITHFIITASLFVCILLPFALHRWFIQQELLLPQLIFFFGLAALAAFYLPRFEKSVKYFIDHRIFRGRYDHETAMVSFGNDLRRVFGSDNIVRLAARQIPIIIQGQGVGIYLPEVFGDDYQLAAENDLPCREKIPLLGPDHPIFQLVAREQQRLTYEEVAYGNLPVSQSEKILAAFDACQAVLAIPLVSQGLAVGIMFLGEKKHDNIYSLDDFKLIESLASQLAFALDNARLYQQILESERLYKTVLRYMQRAVVAVDADFRVTILNNTAEELFGVKEKEWLGRRIDEQMSMLGDILKATIKQEMNQNPREVDLTANGKRFPCECETSIMRGADGQANGALIVCQDLTERKKMEEEIKRMDRLASVGTLAAGVAHEIKNPLVSIKTFAQLLPERHTDTEFRENFGNIVLNEITRINRMIHNLLDFANPVQQEIGEFDLHEHLDRAFDLLSNEFQRRKFQIDRDYLDGPAVISGDSKQLYQVFINVLQNAIQFANSEQPMIKVSTRWKNMTIDGDWRSQKGVEINFLDNGQGINSEDLPRIFDPFYSTREEGSGLGLAICHSILQNHNAEINVRSVPYMETVFSFTLPAECHGRVFFNEDIGSQRLKQLTTG